MRAECWIGGKETEVSQGSRSRGTGKHGVSRDSGKREKIPSCEVGCGVTPTEQSGPGKQRRDIHRPKATGVTTVQVNWQLEKNPKTTF